MSAARSALSRLLEQLLDQSADGVETDTLRLPPRPDVKVSPALGDPVQVCVPPEHLSSLQALVSNLQQHFLLFSQRLHSAEVERRSLRVELANQKRGQRLLSSVSQLCHTCSSRIGWLEQEVSAHRSHVTALLSELQDVCLRDNQAFVPVRRFSQFPETFPLANVDKPPPVLLSDWPKDLADRISPAPPEINPTPSSPLCKSKAKKVKKKKKVGGST
uniref:Uncharacterized protein n=1 Tax=Acanthochromis polyacanthus TaxID=80966 RepID=A0A3Q1EWM4_9TELE